MGRGYRFTTRFPLESPLDAEWAGCSDAELTNAQIYECFESDNPLRHKWPRRYAK